MLKAVRGLIRSLLSLVVLMAAAYGGWRWGDAFFPAVETRLGFGSRPALVVEGTEPSEALGEETLARLEAFLEGDGQELELTGSEITSLLRHGRPDLLPTGLRNPTVRLQEGRVEASARAAVADLHGLPDLGPVSGMLPDTILLRMTGSVMGFGEDQAAVFAQGVEVAGVPLPRQVIPEIMAALGRSDQPGLPEEAVAVSLPPGIASVHVSGDRLVLVADR